MLVLTRKAGEQIVVSEDIIVTITRIQGRRIRLAIDAPASVPIRRGELSVERPGDEPGPGAMLRHA
jgi:carbon storage regulator